MTIAQDAVVRALDAYCFEEIWNEPLLEYADNVKLISVAPRFLINWIIAEKYTPLPTNGLQYAVYQVSMTLLEGSLIIPKNTWVSTDNIANQYKTLFHVYSNTGIMAPKSSVFLYYSSYSNIVFVAIQKEPLLTVVGINDWTEMYMSVYRYLQSENPLTVLSFYVPFPSRFNSGFSITTTINFEIAQSLRKTSAGTTIYVNGYDIPPGNVTITTGDYIDIITDTTVVGVYSVNLTTTNTGYMSNFYNVYKQVLHCPKALNPQNQIMTVELLSLTARRNTDNVGLYITKSAENSVTQITHNDVGINTEVVNAMRATLGTQDISIEVKIRTHQKTVIREINYIDYLYICDDSTILNFLIGSGDASLPFWTAASLEQSAYVSYMSASPTLASSQTLTSYITGLGYYTVLSVLCQHINNYPVMSLPMSNLSVPKPLILTGLPTYPVVYIDGIKVKDTQVGFSNTSQDKILIGFTSDVYYTTGQTITVDVIEAGESIPYIISPSATATNITVPFNDIQVFQVNTLTTPVNGYDATSSVSCTPVAITTNGPIQSYVTSTGTQVVFGLSTYGNTYIIQNNVFSRVFGLDITAQVAAQTPVHIELETLCNDGTTLVPFVGYNSLDVYLNGNRLIPKIDYSAIPIVDVNSNTAIVQILICNMQFIAPGVSNYLEVIARTGTIIQNEIGYIANNLMNMNNSVEFWYSGMSEAFGNGKLLLNPTDAGDSLSPTPAIGNGIPFYILTELPTIISSVLAGYTTTADDNRITLINTYFNNLTPENNISTLIIPESWKLYSPYLAAIYATALTNTQFDLFSNDPDQTKFLAQFAEWNYLIANDPTVNPAISLVDLRFCDINPSYGTVSVPDTNTYTILRRLETIMLANDKNTLGDVVSG